MPHVLHTIWLDSHEPTNKDTLWIKPLKKDYYGIFVYGSNGWVLTTAMFKGTIGEFVIDQLPEATTETNGVMAAQDKRDLEMLKEALANIDVIIEAINNIDQTPTEGSQHMVTSGGVHESLEGKVDAVDGKELSANDYTDEDKNKLGGIEEGANKNVKPDWNESDTGSDAFIRNKPDLSGFITRTVNDLANYYLKSETYTKEEVAALISAIRQFHYEVYAALPATGEGNVLYLIGPTGSGSDKYEEYVYANNGWVKIGDTSIDLSGYVTIEALNQAVAGLGTAIEGKEDVFNKVTSLSSSSTNTQYPSAKCVYDGLAGKQSTLVPGTNIKTINNQSLLGSGNITIEGGGSGGDSPVSVIDTINGDFELQDESGNVLLRLADGHIQTKEFNSSDFSVEEKKPLRILFFGNSLTQDVVAYLPLVLNEVAPEIDFHIYLWYNGGQNLTNQYQTYLLDPTKNCGIFSQIKSGDTKWTNYSNNKNMNWVIANCDFDILCLQEYGNNGQSDSQIITAFDNISDWFATYYDKPLKVVSLMDAPARGDVSGVTTRIEHYNQVFYQNCPSEGIIPAGLAMSYACQDSTLNQLGDSGGLSPDGVHAQEGLPCLLQSYVVAMWLFREMGITKSIWGSKLRITTAIYTDLDVPGANLGTGVITGTDVENILAQRCAIKAMKRGRELEVLTVNS